MVDVHHVVIIGGGFGGLYAAKSLRNTSVQVTLIDRRNFHLFQPLLYQVATGALSPGNIAAPLRAILKHQKNTQVLLGEVIDIDVAGRSVLLSDGTHLRYDTVVVAAGARHHYFGKSEWEQLAPGLKTIEDATEMRRRILIAFENAEREQSPEKIRAWLTFVIVGAGPTGLELAGALAEIAHDTLKHDFRSINPADAQILLIEGTDRVLPPYTPDLSAKAARQVAQLGVKVLTHSVVTEIQPDSVTLRLGETLKKIPTHTVLWGAGVQASPLGQVLAHKTGSTLDKAGRVIVEPDLTLPGHPEIFVIGDMSNYSHQTGKPLPGVCQVAMQAGYYVARVIHERVRGQRNFLLPFRYKDKGNMATIGRAKAVADVFGLHFSGFAAWFLWLFIHIMYLIEFENRLLVLTQWAWNYFTRNRAARLITGETPKR
jgi:NADH dehydrogenase